MKMTHFRDPVVSQKKSMKIIKIIKCFQSERYYSYAKMLLLPSARNVICAAGAVPHYHVVLELKKDLLESNARYQPGLG